VGVAASALILQNTSTYIYTHPPILDSFLIKPYYHTKLYEFYFDKVKYILEKDINDYLMHRIGIVSIKSPYSNVTNRIRMSANQTR